MVSDPNCGPLLWAFQELAHLGLLHHSQVVQKYCSWEIAIVSQRRSSRGIYQIPTLPVRKTNLYSITFTTSKVNKRKDPLWSRSYDSWIYTTCAICLSQILLDRIPFMARRTRCNIMQ